MKRFLAILFSVFFTFSVPFSKNAFSYSNPWDCVNDKNADYLTIIKDVEKDMKLWEASKNYNQLFSDLWGLHRCYKESNQKEKYTTKIEYLIDQNIISEGTYNNWEDNDLFKKDKWKHLFGNYILDKITGKKIISLGRTSKEWNYLKIILNILNIEKEKNIQTIFEVTYFSYLEENFDLDFAVNEVMQILDENINFTDGNKLDELFLHFSSQKIQFLYNKRSMDECANFFDIEIKKKLSSIDLKKIKNTISPTLVVRTYESLEKIFQTAHFCKPYSFAHAREYLKILDFLIAHESDEKDIAKYKDRRLGVTEFISNNYYVIGDYKSAAFHEDELDKRLEIYDVSDYVKIKHKLVGIKRIKNLAKAEKKIFDYMDMLSNLTLENYQKSFPYADENIFLFEKEKLKLTLLLNYSSILEISGRKIEAVKVLKEIINFYESLRKPNKYDILIEDKDLKYTKETNQVLPDLYHKIILLFANLNDLEEAKKYASYSFNLCDKINDIKNHFCYKNYLSYLKAVKEFKSIKDDYEKIILTIDKVDESWLATINDPDFSLYSEKNRAALTHNYYDSTLFAINRILHEFGNNKIINFKYRKKERVLDALCSNDHDEKILKNAKLLDKDDFRKTHITLGMLSFKWGCFLKLEKPGEEGIPKSELDKLYKMSVEVLDEYETFNKTREFIYLDKIDKTDNTPFFMGMLIAALEESGYKKEKIQFLKELTFKNLQYEEAESSVKTRKNFVNKFVNSKLNKLIEERQKLKLNYANLISKIYDNFDMVLDQALNNEKNLTGKRLNEINKIIKKDFPKFSNLNKREVFTVKQIQKKLKKDEALLVLINEEIHQAYVITNGKFEFQGRYVGADFARLITNIRKDIINLDSILLKNLSAEMYSIIFKPIEKSFKDKKKLYIIADKHFSGLPFEMLITTERSITTENRKQKWQEDFEPRYFVEGHNINYLPNVASFFNLKASTKTKINSKSQFLGIGDPKFKKISQNITSENTAITFSRGGFIKDTRIINERYEELPFTSKELDALKNVFAKSSLLTREKANEKKIKELKLEKFDVISFATHAEVSGTFEDFNEPFLVLSPPNVPNEYNDGLLTSSEISELNLNAELVILSACDTGSKLHKYAAGFSGLINSFFVAGSRSVIATHWPVADESGYLLMSETMKKVSNLNQTVSQALKNTKIEFIKGKYGEQFKNPLFWAPYVYVGI